MIRKLALFLSLAIVSTGQKPATQMQCFGNEQTWVQIGYQDLYNYFLSFNIGEEKFTAYYRGSRESDDQRDQPLYYEAWSKFDANNQFVKDRYWMRTAADGGKCAAIDGDEVIMYRCNAGGTYPTAQVRNDAVFFVDHQQEKYFRLYADTESKTIKGLDCGPESELPENKEEFLKRLKEAEQ